MGCVISKKKARIEKEAVWIPEDVTEEILKKKARIEKEAVWIPEDVTEEILKKLPVKSLLRFRCACKTWYSVCNKLHRKRACVLICERSKKFSTVTIESLLMNEKTPIRPTPLSLPWQPDPEPFDISSNENQFLGSCNGLICVDHIGRGWDRLGLILWNPSTRKFRRLPRDHRDDCKYNPWTYAWFGYDESVDDIKLLWVKCRNPCFPGIELEVFTLKSNTWRSGHTPHTDFILSGMDTYRHKSIGVLSNGAIHWVARSEDRSCYGIRILALDLSSEKFRLLKSPHGRRLGPHTWVGSLSGCLCLCLHSEAGEDPVDGMDLWMMKEYGVDSSWIKLLSLPMPFIRPHSYFLRFYPILFSNEEGIMVAMFEHVYPSSEGTLIRPGAADEIMRLQIEKGAIVSSETLLRVSRDRGCVPNASEGHLFQNYAVLHMEESPVSLN